MEIRGLDLHKRERQRSRTADDGTITDRRIVTSRERFTAVVGARRRARILREATEQQAQKHTTGLDTECRFTEGISIEERRAPKKAASGRSATGKRTSAKKVPSAARASTRKKPTRKTARRKR